MHFYSKFFPVEFISALLQPHPALSTSFLPIDLVTDSISLATARPKKMTLENAFEMHRKMSDCCKSVEAVALMVMN